jgi:two-component system alkaline phosphatase synthesis response regulator PhoP
VRKRILIADDDDDVREIAGSTIELTTDWEVVTASCGREALEVAGRTIPDVILLDVMMPDMDGPTTFNLLRADPRTAKIPVILLTAKVQSIDRQRYTRLGVDGVIAKPFDPMTLAETIAEVVQWNAPLLS